MNRSNKRDHVGEWRNAVHLNEPLALMGVEKLLDKVFARSGVASEVFGALVKVCALGLGDGPEVGVFRIHPHFIETTRRMAPANGASDERYTIEFA